MSFQIPTTTTASTGFSFGLSSTPAATTSAVSSATAKPTTLTFGSTGGGDAGVPKPLTFGTPTTTTTTTATAQSTGGFGSGGFLSQPAAAATTTTNATAAAPQPTISGFSFGAGTTPAAAAGTAAAPAAAPTTTATTGFSFGSLTSAATTSTTVTTTAAAAPTFSLTSSGGLAAKTTASALPPLGGLAATTTAVSTSGGFANLSTATKTTDSTAITAATQLSYNQLEEHINKWTLELEEQEKVFIDQATQINAWDKILIGNNQKILELNDAVQKVKCDQQTLEQELEFIATQHKELEESIVPLQKEFMKLPQVDVERSQTYLLVENLDTQLKQMSEDLKEIIDNLNEATKGQDNSDPIIQIGKILNAHMGSLQWIESSSTNIANKLDDITKMHESFKRESERSFRSAYYH